MSRAEVEQLLREALARVDERLSKLEQEVFPDVYYNDIQYFPAAWDDEIGMFGTHPRVGRASSWNNVRIVVEPLSDKIDPPRYFPGVGWAQLHHAQYRATIYGDLLNAHPASEFEHRYINANEQQVLLIDRDHLQLYLPGTPQVVSSNITNPAGEAASSAETPPLTSAARSAAASPRPAVQRHRDELAQSLTTAPDGTIYKLGSGQTGLSAVGSEPGPYFLWQLPPNGEWTPIDYIYSFEIGPDSRLYILDSNRNLRTPALGPSGWATLATDVESIHVTPDGALFMLNSAHELRSRAAGASVWSAPEAGVRSLLLSPSGTLYAVTDRGELRQRTGSDRWTVIDRGVQSYAMMSDGTIYELNGQRQLIRLTETLGRKVLARGVRSLQVAPDGGVYALSDGNELMKLTARDHWTVLDSDVLTFQIAPNGDLYLINQRHELRREKVGYSWMTLQTDIESMTIYSDGTVTAFDSHQQRTLYSSLGPYFTLEPIAPGETAFALDPPSPFEVVSAANLRSTLQFFPYALPLNSERSGTPYIDLDMPFSSGSEPGRMPPVLRASSTVHPVPLQRTVEDVSFVTELVLDVHDPARFVPGLGPAQLHRAQYKSTVYYTTEAGVREQLVVYIDHDHFHMLEQSGC